MGIATLEQARSRFLKFGHCDCELEFRVTSQPLQTDIVLTNCGVCGKEHDRKIKNNLCN